MALIEREAKAPASLQPEPKAVYVTAELLPPFAVTELRGAGSHGSRQFHTHLCSWCTDLYTHTVDIDGCSKRATRLCLLCKDVYKLVEKGEGYDVA